MQETFESYRSYLFAIAYRMLGSARDAEDMVQETYLRYSDSPPATIRSLKAYLATILTRLCMDQLKLAHRQREVYVGPWLPEPILTAKPAETGDPETRVATEESISLAFLVLMDQLQPFERAVFLLREVFEYEFAEIAAMLGKSETATRRSFSRAKRHLRERRPRFQPSPDKHRQLLERFAQAVGDGDLDGLLQMLAEDVTMWADGGGKAPGAITQPLHGRAAVAKFLAGATRLAPEGYRTVIEVVNGEPAIVVRAEEQVIVVVFIEAERALIKAVRAVGNPDKLKRV